MREDLRHFIDVSMNASTKKYELLGDGITAITEEMNAEEEQKQYIHQSVKTNVVKSYQRSFEIDKEDCVEDEVQKWIDDMVDKLPVGTSAQTTFVRFRLKDKVDSQTDPNALIYTAFQVPCTITVQSAGGDAGDYVHNVVTVRQCGEVVKGTFTLGTKAFAPDPSDV